MSQLYKASDRSCRHRNTTFWFSDTLIFTDEGTSAKSIIKLGKIGAGQEIVVSYYYYIIIVWHNYV